MSDGKFKEILKLDSMLTEAGIPHVTERAQDGWQVFYPDKYQKICDAIEFTGSFGCDDNLLELMGLLTDEEIKKDYDERTEK